MFYCDKEIPGCRESTRQIAFHGGGEGYGYFLELHNVITLVHTLFEYAENLAGPTFAKLTQPFQVEQLRCKGLAAAAVLWLRRGQRKLSPRRKVRLYERKSHEILIAFDTLVVLAQLISKKIFLLHIAMPIKHTYPLVAARLFNKERLLLFLRSPRLPDLLWKKNLKKHIKFKKKTKHEAIWSKIML